MDKVEIDLHGVPQTLLLPLLGRATFSEKSYSPIRDERAVALVKTLNYNFKNLESKLGSSLLFWIARAFHFDEAIKAYIKMYPHAVIVNLGCGLETAFYRIDNEKLTWVDIDLPEVIDLRRQLFPSHERVHLLAKSILDYSWLDDVRQLGSEFLFLAGGVFMYFTETDIKLLLTEMAMRFPRSELVFDTLSKRGVYYANKMLARAAIDNAALQWGTDDAREMEGWSSNIRFVRRIPSFSTIKSSYPFPLRLRLKMYFLDLADKGGIIKLRF
jgi:O-methyltransferase involved in polyketide biosynthesis